MPGPDSSKWFHPSSLQSSETEEEESFLKHDRSIRERASNESHLWKLLCLLSWTLNIFLLGGVSYLQWPDKDVFFPGVLHKSTATVLPWQDLSDYSAEDPEATESLWNEIFPEHGIVAVDHSWAKQQDLMSARSLPSDPSKGIYVVEGYHVMHCLQAIRKDFFHMAYNGGNQSTIETPLHHHSHCFDSIRQGVMCAVPDGLLAIGAGNFPPDGQLRKCKDWSQLRDWASQHTPCTGDIGLNNHFVEDFCHGPNDGIRILA